MTTLFWASLAFVFYTYVGYPVLVWLAARTRGEPPVDPGGVTAWPRVCVVVAVYNEENRVTRKIDNLLSTDYPRDRLEILFVSDGSTDNTNARLAARPEVRLLSYGVRSGKPQALNHAVAATQADVIVFTDVRQMLYKDAIRFLVARLWQSGIGAVSGELIHLAPGTSTQANIGLYWRYEKWIRKSESRWHSTAGVTGALYAIRREDFRPLPADTLLDDFEVPMAVVRSGKRVVFEPRARIYDELQTHASGERKRKIRTLTGNFQSFWRNPWLFSPWHNPIFVQFISHKAFRLFVPYALVVIFIASLLADHAFYRALAWLQGAGYGLALCALAWPRLQRLRPVGLLAVFLELNWAAVVALRNFLFHRTDSRWEKT